MLVEQSKTYPIPLSVGDFTKSGVLRPSAVLNLAQRVTDEHLFLSGVGISKLWPYHLSWVLILTALRISPIPEDCMSLAAKTWGSELRGPYFRREIEFYSPEGERLICFSSFSVLLDLKGRNILRPSALPLPLTPPTPVFAIDHLSPKLPIPCETRHSYNDIIRNGHIDLLGHVNNSHYADFALNCLTPEEFSRGVCEIDINFLAELQNGSSFSLSRGEDERGNIWVKGEELGSPKTSFAARVKLFAD